MSRGDLRLQLDSGTLNPVEVVRDLGVLLDCELSMKQHIARIASNSTVSITCSVYDELDVLLEKKSHHS